MPRGKQGLKAGRADRNKLFQNTLRERKRLRWQRRESLRDAIPVVSAEEAARDSEGWTTLGVSSPPDYPKRAVQLPTVDTLELETAFAEAQRLRRTKKKGKTNLDKNMEALGYRRIADEGEIFDQWEKI